MAGSIFLEISILLLFVTPTCIAQASNQDWIFPRSPHDSSIINTGSAATFKWTSSLSKRFPQLLPNSNASDIDVWITDITMSKTLHKLAAGLDISSTTTLHWANVMIPGTDVGDENKWSLRFVAAGDNLLNGTANQISSPSFYINSTLGTTTAAATISITPSELVESTSSLTSATQSRASTTSTTATSLNSKTSTEAATSGSKSTNLSTTAKVGIGAGVCVASACVAALLAVCLSRHRASRSNSTSHGDTVAADRKALPKMEIQTNVSRKAYRTA